MKVQRGRKRIEMEAGLSITSMMDMFTILLIYLLYFFDPSQDPARSLELASSEATGSEAAGMVLTVTPEAIWMGEKEIARMGEGMGGLQEALKGANPDENLTIQCDRRVAYKDLNQVLTTASQAGLKKYRFMVLNAPAEQNKQ